MTILQTEIEFTLKLGYVDESGTRHTKGKMRLATAADEIMPLKDPRVQANGAYLTVIVLSRVIVSLGTLPMINTQVVEGLFSADFADLQALYNRINQHGSDQFETQCPKCSHRYEVAPPQLEMG